MTRSSPPRAARPRCARGCASRPRACSSSSGGWASAPPVDVSPSHRPENEQGSDREERMTDQDTEQREDQDAEQREDQSGGADGREDEAAKAEEAKERYEKAEEKIKELEEDPPTNLEDWPDDEAKYITL